MKHATSHHDKVDGYDIQHSIVMNISDPTDAVRLKCTILELLDSMGEHMPPNLSDEEIESEVAAAIQGFESISDHDLLHMYTNSDAESQADIIRAYYILCDLMYLGSPRMHPYYVARWIQFCLKHKVKSKYIPGEINLFSLLLHLMPIEIAHANLCAYSCHLP